MNGSHHHSLFLVKKRWHLTCFPSTCHSHLVKTIKDTCLCLVENIGVHMILFGVEKWEIYVCCGCVRASALVRACVYLTLLMHKGKPRCGKGCPRILNEKLLTQHLVWINSNYNYITLKKGENGLESWNYLKEKERHFHTYISQQLEKPSSSSTSSLDSRCPHFSFFTLVHLFSSPWFISHQSVQRL